MSRFARARRLSHVFRWLAHWFPPSFTLLDRLFTLRQRFPVFVDAWRTRLELTVLEGRIVPEGRPLPLPVLFAGAGTGMAAIVRGYDAETGNLQFERTVFESSFTGGVRVAAGDITRDGYPDLIASAGPGGSPRIRVLDGKTGEQIAGPLGSFLAFEPTFRGGVMVASADVNRDGVADIITAAGTGGGPRVRVFSGVNGTVLADFLSLDADFRGGVTVAAADLTGDGYAEIAIGAGEGGGPRVKVYDPTTWEPIAGPLGSFFAFEESSRSGVWLGADALAGDVDADGTPDLAIGTGPGVAPRVKVLSGATGAVLMDFAPFAVTATGGVRVALAYVNDDPFADVVTGTGPGVPATIRVFSGATGEQLAAPIGEYLPFGSTAMEGVYIGASNDPPDVGVEAIDDAAEPDTSGRFRFTRSGSTDDPLNIIYDVGGTANSPADYVSSLGTGLTFGVGVSSIDVWIDPVDDELEEGSETVSITIGSSKANYTSLDNWTAVVTIYDDDTSPPPPPPPGPPTPPPPGPPPPPPPFGGIGDFVWIDEDADGVHDTAEVGAAGVSVTLTGGSLPYPLITVTDEFGAYTFTGFSASVEVDAEPHFTGLEAGTYVVHFTAPSGYGFSTPTGGEVTITLTTGEVNNDVDAGLIPPGSIGDLIWYDENANGTQDMGEDGAPGYTVTLTGGGISGSLTATTDAGGHYSFTGLEAGTYVVHFPAAPLGYGYSTPGSADVTVSLSASEDDDTVDAGLVPPPDLGGQILVALAGREYDGTLAAIDTAIPATLLEAIIQWGDGVSSTGTISDSVILGEHTYAHDGFYALAVRVTVPTIAGVRNYAAGLGLVLSPTSHLGPETVRSVVATGGGGLGGSVTLLESGGFETTASGEFDYALLETVDGPTGTSTLSLSGSISTFTLFETGGDFPQPNSTLSLQGEVTSHRTESIAAPQQFGAATEDSNSNYTLTQTGTGASYTWTRTDTASLTRHEAGWVNGGTFEADIVGGLNSSASGSRSGSSSSESWTGSESVERVETGLIGPDAYSFTRTATGTLVGSETGSGATFDRLEQVTGDYTLVESTSNTVGASDSAGGGTYGVTLVADGNGWTGEVSADLTGIETYLGTGTAALAGVSSAVSTYRTSSDSSAASGGGIAGLFHLAGSSGQSATATSTSDNQGVLSTETRIASQSGSKILDTAIDTGTYTLTGSNSQAAATTGSENNADVWSHWTGTESSEATFTETGDRTTGEYDSATTAATTETSTVTRERTATAYADDGTTGQHTIIETVERTAASGVTSGETGNVSTGEYDSHQTFTSESTSTTTDSDNIQGDGLGGHADAVTLHSTHSTRFESGSLDRVGNHLTGTYSLHASSAWSATAIETASIDQQSGQADGTSFHRLEIHSSSSDGSGTVETDVTGNELTGDYTLHTDNDSTGVSNGDDSATAIAHAADGSEEGSQSTFSSVGTWTESGSQDITGNELTGDYILGSSSSSDRTVIESGTVSGNTAQADGTSFANTDTVTTTYLLTDSAASTGHGNDILQSYTLHETADWTHILIASSSGTQSALAAAGSSADGTSTSTSTGTDTGIATTDSTGNDVLGDYSLHTEQTNTVITERVQAVGQFLLLVSGTALDSDQAIETTTTETGSATVIESGNSIGLDYSQSRTSTITAATTGTATEQDSLETADGGTSDNAPGADVLVSVDATVTAAESEAGNWLLGGYASSQSRVVTSLTTVNVNEEGTATAADGTTGTGSSTLDATRFETASSGSVELGNRLTQNYSLTAGDSNDVTAFVFESIDATATASDGAEAEFSFSTTTTASQSASTSVVMTGDRVIGRYTLVEVDAASSASMQLSGGDSSFTAADTSTLDDGYTATASASSGSNATVTETGSHADDYYSRFVLGSASWSASDTGDGDVSLALADGSAGNSGGSAGSSASGQSTTTLTVTGQFSGAFAQTGNGTFTIDASNSSDGLGTLALFDGSTSNWNLDALASVHATGTTSSSVTGSTATGDYTLHETDSTTATLIGSGDHTSMLALSDGGTGSSGLGGNWNTDLTLTATTDATGNERTGAYDRTTVESSDATTVETSSGSGSFLATDSSTGSGAGDTTATTFATWTATTIASGNANTGVYNLHETGVTDATTTGVSTDSGVLALASGASASDSGNTTFTLTTSTDYTATASGNAATGAFVRHQEAEFGSSGFAVSTNSGSDAAADGTNASGGSTVTAWSTGTGTSEADLTGNSATGTYSLHATDTATITTIATSTGAGTLVLADGSTDGGDGTLLSTSTASATSTRDVDVNEVTGDYSIHEVASYSADTTGTSSGGGTAIFSEGSSGTRSGDSSITAFESGSSTLDRVGNSSTGTYSLTIDSSASGAVQAISSSGGTLAGSGAVDSAGNSTSTASASWSSTAELTRTGNTSSGDYTLHALATSERESSVDSSGGATVTAADASLRLGGATVHLTASSSRTVETDLVGNDSTGTFSLHQTDSGSYSAAGHAEGDGTRALAGGSTGGDAGSSDATASGTFSFTRDATGNTSSGEYSLHETGTTSADQSLTSTSDSTITTDSLDTNVVALTQAAGSHTTGTTTLDRTGNSSTGTYSLTANGTYSSTAFGSGSSDTDYTAAGWSDTAAIEGSATVTAEGSFILAESGNTSTGDFILHREQTGTGTLTLEGEARGLPATMTIESEGSATVDETGNWATGSFILTASSEADLTLTGSGTDGRGPYTASGSGHSEAITTASGSATGHEATTIATDSGTLVVSGGTATTYDRTVTATGSSTLIDAGNDIVGVSAISNRVTALAAVNESGSSATTDYDLTEITDSTAIESASVNALTGAYSLSQESTVNASLHEVGTEGTAGEFTLDKVTNRYDDLARLGNVAVGGYTLSGSSGDTSTAIESFSHGGYGASFTEILAEDTTRTGNGDHLTGAYVLVEAGTLTANYVQDGTTSAGTHHITESSTGTFDRTTVGNDRSGGYSLTEAATIDYAATEIVNGSESWTLIARGTDTTTIDETGDEITGLYLRNEVGVDDYTVSESGTLSGGAFSETVTGLDNYTVAENGNHATGVYDRETIGGGSWVRTSSGAGLATGSGTNTYTLTEIGDSLAAHFEQSITGDTRYALVSRFDDVSNGTSGTTPGNVTFYSHGLVFRDPGPTNLLVPRAQADSLAQDLSLPGMPVTIHDPGAPSQFVYLVISDAAQNDPIAHNHMANVLSARGLRNETITDPATGTAQPSELQDAMYAIYRGSTGSSPPGYTNRYLIFEPNRRVQIVDAEGLQALQLIANLPPTNPRIDNEHPNISIQVLGDSRTPRADASAHLASLVPKPDQSTYKPFEPFPDLQMTEPRNRFPTVIDFKKWSQTDPAGQLLVEFFVGAIETPFAPLVILSDPFEIIKTIRDPLNTRLSPEQRAAISKARRDANEITPKNVARGLGGIGSTTATGYASARFIGQIVPSQPSLNSSVHPGSDHLGLKQDMIVGSGNVPVGKSLATGTTSDNSGSGEITSGRGHQHNNTGPGMGIPDGVPDINPGVPIRASGTINADGSNLWSIPSAATLREAELIRTRYGLNSAELVEGGLQQVGGRIRDADLLVLAESLQLEVYHVSFVTREGQRGYLLVVGEAGRTGTIETNVLRQIVPGARLEGAIHAHPPGGTISRSDYLYSLMENTNLSIVVRLDGRTQTTTIRPVDAAGYFLRNEGIVPLPLIGGAPR